ncbi:MAG: flagellar biosynthetic protein FliO [Gallionella sp.]
MSRLHSLFATVMLATPVLASAMDGTRPTYAPPPPAVSSSSIVQIIFSLLLVLAAIVLVAWLLKRMNLAQQGTAGYLKVIGGVAIGQRERVVLVEIDDTWLVVGVGPGQIRTLHTLPKPAGGASDVTNSSTPPASADRKFASMLASVISHRPASRKPDAH